MGTAIYGSHDELVFELSIRDRVRNLTSVRTVRVRLDDVVWARAADARDLVSWAGERLLRIGRVRPGQRVVVLELAGASAYDRIVVVVDDADEAVAGLWRSGIGRGTPVAA